MTSLSLRVNLAERSYDIAVTHGDLAGVGPFARERSPASSVFIVSDEHVRPHAQIVFESLQKSGFRVAFSVRPAGEEQKSLHAAAELYDQLVELPADRRTLVVAVGGGVIGDLAGFVAATFARGLPLLMVPTTLLAMVDSSVGGKVAVNHPRAKNMIGAFHQPIGVWIDTATLGTLPDREYRSGLAEVVKYGVIMDADFFSYLEANVQPILERDPAVLQHVIARCCRRKADVVERDERETTGLRAILNYGHTFAHAFEVVGKYGQWLHGEAVSAGMICASTLAERLGLNSADVTGRQVALLRAFGLPTAPLAWPASELLAVMRSDKKARDGNMVFILPRRIGEVGVVENVPPIEVENVLAACGLACDPATPQATFTSC